ncbi:MAG TPA: CheR family methyltransferase [Burkholderiales bacterium]|nr:CheR family methyltransferase [Burkholderiales bacterium]
MKLDNLVPGNLMQSLQHDFSFTRQDFHRVRELIAEYAGISLHERKENMVYNRLSRRLRATGKSSFRDYLDWVEQPDSEERERFINALTTNLTAFFRESHHFDMLVAQARRAGPLRVWSSACSTGEEPYSAAIALREAGCAARILATDIDTDALAVARRGVYPLEALERAGRSRMQPHFLRGTGGNDGLARLRPEVREMVSFEFRNLLATHWAPGERFDAVFCRNVIIYFDRAGQQRLLDRLAAVLMPGGLLFLGHSESCAAGHPAFRASGKTAYTRR